MADGTSKLGALSLQLGLESDDFNKSIASINRQLKIVQSEFSAVDDGTKDFANSMEGLGAKSNMLTKQLKLQEVKVNELNRQYEESVREKGKDAKATQNLMRTYNNSIGDMRKLERKIEEVNEALKDQGNSFDTARTKMNEYLDKAGDIGGRLSSVTTPALTGLGAGVMTIAEYFEKGTSRIQRSFGITQSEAEDLNKISRDIWKRGFVDSLSEVEDALIQTKQNIKGLNEGDLEEVTKNAIYLGRAFESDVNVITRAGYNIMKGFGISTEEAFDLMAWGAQNGLNFSQELFDNLLEYAPLFSKMGFSADEYFQLLEKGSSAGVTNLDFINDSMKEFQIRAKDGSETTSEAFGKLSESSQKVWKSYLKGEATLKDVHNSVIKDLSNMDDQTIANQIGVDLYGTKWEDLESTAMYSLGNINGGIKNVDGAMARSGDNVEKTFTEKLRSSFREISDSLVPLGDMLIDIADRVLPKVEGAIIKVTDWWNGLNESSKNTALAVGGIALVLPPLITVLAPVTKAFGGLFGIIGRIVGSLGAGAGAGAGLTGALAGLGAPALIAGGIIATLGAGFLVLDKQMDKPAIKSDIFAGKISENTKKALGSFEELRLGAEAELDYLGLSHAKVSDEIANSLTEKYKQMGNQVLAQMQENHTKEYEAMKQMFANTDALTEEEEQKRLGKLLENQAKENETHKINEQKKLDIIAKANEENRALTEEEYKQIAELNRVGHEKAIEELTANQQEQLTILKNLKEQKGILSAEESANTVNFAKETKDKVVAEANKKYKETVKSAELGRDVLGTLSKEEADEIIKQAEREKNEVVSQAEDQHYEVVKQAQQQAGKHVNEVDWETGSVMNKWDKMWNRIADVWNPIAEMFNLDKMKKRGEYKVNRRQRLADQNAKITARATGTPNGDTHEGGLALVGEEGVELAHIPNQGYTMLGVGGQEIVNLPKGSSVLPNNHTERIMKYYGFPAYADGVGNFDIFDIFTKGAKSFWNGAIERSGLFKDVVMPSWFPSSRKIMSKISGGIIEKLDKAVDKMFSFDFGAFGTRGARMAQEAIIQALKITGKPISWLSPMMTIAKHESGFNPNAINLWDINAERGDPSVGLFQIIQSTFDKYKMGGMNNRRNPLHSAVTAIKYMDSRYGGVYGHPGIKSLARGGGYLPYEDGGVVSQEQIALLGEGNKEEVVIPLDKHKNNRSMDLLAYANLRLGVFQRFENFFENILLAIKQSTETLISQLWDQTDVLAWRLEAITPTGANTDDLLYVNSLSSYKEAGIKAEDGSWVSSSFYGLPDNTGTNTGATVNNNYSINVAYSGSTQGADVSQLAKEIRRELERQDQLNSRSYGVI